MTTGTRGAVDLAHQWPLAPGILHLNHGSFGACPTPVLEAQARLRAQLERDPMTFFVRDMEPLMDAARRTLGSFVGAPPDDLAFVPNATTGVNVVLRSLAFKSGDEILVTDHEYNACANALAYAAGRADARVVVVPIPFPLTRPDVVIEAVLDRISPRTRLLLIDHITSPTALVLPIEPIIRELDRRGIDTLVDGAHGPGMLPLDLARLGAAYYTGNCHKWLCAPKGAALLYVRPDRQAQVRPLAISHGATWPLRDRTRFQLEFVWTGTHDPSAYLSVPEAIHFLGNLLPGGWPELRDSNRALALAGREILAQALDIPLPAPAEMLGSMATLILGNDPPADPSAAFPYQTPLEKALAERFRIAVPVMAWPHPRRHLLRISAQVYNHREQYEKLAAALNECGDLWR